MAKENQVQELANEVENLSLTIHDLKGAIEGLSGELFMLVKTLEKRQK